MIALIDPFKEEMKAKGFPSFYLNIHHDMWSGRISLSKSEEANKHANTVRDYIKECEIDDLSGYSSNDVMELASNFVGDHIVPEGITEEEGNSDWYEDLIDYWISVFLYNIAELMMYAYFVKYRDAVER